MLLRYICFFMKTVAIIVVVIASVETALSQGSDNPDREAYDPSDSLGNPEPSVLWQTGGFLGFHRNVYTADDIKGLPGIPSCCPDYTSGGGLGIVIGLTGGLPFDDLWQVHFRGEYSSYSGKFKANEYELVHLASTGVDSSSLALATFEHTLEASLGALSVETFVSYEAFNNFFVSLGGRGDLLIHKTFDQKEFLASPEGITYENGKRTRLVYEGEIPEAKTLQAAIVANIRYEYPLNSGGDLVVAPELAGWFGLTEPVENLPWSIHGVRVGVSLQYLHLLRPEPEVELPEPDELEILEPIQTGPNIPRAAQPNTPESDPETGSKEDPESGTKKSEEE